MKKIASKRIILREHLEKDFLGNYQNWLLDSEVMEHTDTSINKTTPLELRAYVDNELDIGNIFLAVEDKDTSQHIGNLKIYNLTMEDGLKIAEYSRFIGEKSFWGQGYGKELGLLALDYCFNNLNIDIVKAGCRFDNKKAIISNLKIGFNIIGVKEYEAANKSDKAYSLIFSLNKDTYKQNLT